MSTRIDASGESLSRSASLPAVNAFTILGWVYFHTVRASQFNYVFFLQEPTTPNWVGLAWRASSGNFYIPSSQGGIPEFSSNPPLNQWIFCALRSNGTDVKAFWRAQGGPSFNTLVDAFVPSFTPTSMSIGNTPGGSDWADISVAGVRMWDAGLSDGEISSEYAAGLSRVRTANLNTWFRGLSTGANRADDESGNNRHWTQNGTLSDAANPSFGNAGVLAAANCVLL